MTDLIAELAEVAALSESATPGKWFVAFYGLPSNTWRVADCGGSKSNLPNPLVAAEVSDYCKPAEMDAVYIATLSNLFRTHHATLTRILTDDAAIRAAHTELVIRLGELTEKLEAANRETHGEREESWEVWQEDMPVAVSDCLPETLHYLAVYQQDGPVTLKRAVVYRETITPEQLAAMHDSAREGGDE